MVKDDKAGVPMLGTKWLETLEEARKLRDAGRFNEALLGLEEARRSLRSGGAKAEDRLNVLVEICHNHFKLGDFNRLEASAKEAMDLISGPGIKVSLKAEAHYFYGIAIRTKGDPLKGLKNIERALSLFESAKDPDGVARTSRAIGNSYMERSQFAKALAYYNRALKLSEDLGNERDARLSKYNIAMALLGQGLFSDASKEFEANLAYFLAKKDEMMTLWSLQGMGEVCLQTGRWDEVLLHCRKSLALCDKLGEKRVRADCLCLIAEAFVEKGDIAQAESTIDDNRIALMEVGVADVRARYLRAKAKVSMAKGDLRNAEEDLREAERILMAEGGGLELAAIYQELAKLKLLAHERSEAKRFFGKAKRICKDLRLPLREKEVEAVMKRECP